MKEQPFFWMDEVRKWQSTVYHEILASFSSNVYGFSSDIQRISLQELISIFSVFKFGEQHYHHPYQELMSRPKGGKERPT